MTDTVTVVGVIGTDPKRVETATGALTSFRLASSQRRFDRATEKWVDGSTNWFSVSAFRDLGTNALTSFTRGDRVIVSGRLVVRPWTSGERSGTDVSITADALGHDIAFGVSSFRKNAPRTDRQTSHSPAVEEDWAAEAPSGGDSVWAAPGATIEQSTPDASLNSVGTPF